MNHIGFAKPVFLTICGGVVFTMVCLSPCFAAPGIKIVEPSDGQIFASGAEIRIVVQPVEGFVVEQVLLGPSFDSRIIYEAPFEATFTIPEDRIGDMDVSAMGKSVSGEYVKDKITVKILPNEALQSIRLDLPMIVLNQGKSWSLYVEGVYPNDLIRDVTDKSTGTSYVSNDLGIVTVTEDGLVEAKGAGEATIKISNSGINLNVPVIVKESLVTDDIAPTTDIDIVPVQNLAGWHNADLTITLTAVDNEGGSGVKEVNYSYSGAVNENQTVVGGEAVLNIATEGATVLSYYATDNAGNDEPQKTYEIKLDKTPSDIVAPGLESVYKYNSEISISYSVNDSLSGIASVSATLNDVLVENGAVITLTKLGSNNFQLEAHDYADNVASQSINFSVEYVFSGFLPPVIADGSKVYKQGRTLPVKFQLQDADQNYISTAKATLTLQQYSDEAQVGEPVEVESTSGADVGNTFRYDPDVAQYIYNLNTESLPSGVWQIQVHLDDGMTKIGTIRLK